MNRSQGHNQKAVNTAEAHGVQFYRNPEDLAEIVASLLGEGLRNGEAALLIVTPERLTRRRFARCTPCIG
jgi:hypothetical protein